MAIAGFAPQAVEAAPHLLVVPTAYPTIQAAVDAAHPGDEIRVRSGTYREQVSIGKDLKLVGSGPGSTTILAPETLAPGEDGKNSIVEIRAGASVTMSRIAVSGPGSGTCAVGALESGIRLIGGGHLDLSYARVVHIHDTPAAQCPHSGSGILVGVISDPDSGSAVIRYSEISDYQAKGILVLSAGPATVFGNVVTGPKHVSADGIDVVFAAGKVSHNVVSGNECRAPDPACGPDVFNDFQHIGIYAGGPGTVITQNLLYGNQVGIYALDSAHIDRNLLWNNDLFGMALQDGSFTVSKDRINGGVTGVAVVAASADSTAVLDGVKISGTSGAPVQELDCCGFTATATYAP